MRETEFIEQNKAKWQRFEEIQSTGGRNPEEVSKLFVEISDDLSYARTFYRHRTVRYYLNGITQRLFTEIHRSRRSRWEQLTSFWKETLPDMIWHSRKPLLLSLVLLVSAIFLGLFSSTQDAGFARKMLGDAYYAMTEANVASGDPMAVYKSAAADMMFLEITINNIRVCFLTYAMGLLFAFGSGFILLLNGVRIGAFLWFFMDKGLLGTATLTLLQHGAIELSVIAIAGGAGFVLGRGLIMPGTLPLGKSLEVAAIQSLTIMLSLIPLLIIAGFIEGFITRQTDAPLMLRLGLVVVSFAIIIGYFIVYPWYRARSGQVKPTLIEPTASNTEEMELRAARSNASIFKDSFQLLAGSIRVLFGLSLIGALLFVGCKLLLTPGLFLDLKASILLHQMLLPDNLAFQSLLAFWPSPLAGLLLLTLTTGIAVLWSLHSHRLGRQRQDWPSLATHHLLKLMLGSLTLLFSASLILYEWSGFGGWICIFLLFPIGITLLNYLLLSVEDRQGIPLWDIFRNRFVKIYLLFGAILAIGAIAYALISQSLMLLLVEALASLIAPSLAGDIIVIAMPVLSICIMMMTALVYLTTNRLQLLSLIEMESANTLLNRIEQFGQNRNIRGLAQED